MSTCTSDIAKDFFGSLIEESQQRIAVEIAEKRLPVKAIRTRETVFQHRAAWSGQSDYHRDELTKALKNLRHDEDLEPITVWWSGRAWYCIDGHHRLKAYHAVRGAGEIPVVVFDGSLEEAFVEALRANTKTKLPMTNKERQDAAWRLVRLEVGSKREQRLASGASEGTVASMRRTRDRLVKERPGEPLPITWWQAQQAVKGLDFQPQGDEVIDEKVREIVEKLRKTFGGTLANKPDMVWAALELYHQGLFKQMWQRAKDEDQWDD